MLIKDEKFRDGMNRRKAENSGRQKKKKNFKWLLSRFRKFSTAVQAVQSIPLKNSGFLRDKDHTSYSRQASKGT